MSSKMKEGRSGPRLGKAMERPMLTSVVLRIKPYKVCIELVPDVSPTHSSGNEHVCTRLV